MSNNNETVLIDTCVVCGSNIIESTYSVFNPIMGPPIFGPGGAQQWNKKITYHCPNCGISYYSLPKSIKERSK